MRDDDTYIVTFLVENVIMPAGRWVLEQVGDPRPTEIASLVTGLAF